jgi:hypothetical protein
MEQIALYYPHGPSNKPGLPEQYRRSHDQVLLRSQDWSKAGPTVL